MAEETILDILMYRHIVTDIMWKDGLRLDIGDIYWVNDYGQFHRDGGPAIERDNGTKMWFRNGKRHRDDGPAIIMSSGSRSWHIDDMLHREDGPALERSNGHKEWYKFGINQPAPE